MLIPTPQSVMSEGIATVAADIALGDERPEFTASAVEGVGVRYDPELSRAVLEANKPFAGVATNAALKLHVDGASVDEAREYVMHWALASEKRAGHVIGFINDPMWRSYITHVPERLQAVRGVRRGRRRALQAPAHRAAHARRDLRSAERRLAPMAVATEREYLLFINGESSEASGGELKELTEPATGEPLAKVAMANEADVDRAVDAARAALDGDWGRTAPTERSRLLHALADALVANRKELAELEVRNVGKALSSVKAELNQAVENFRFYGSAIGSIGGRSNPLGGSLLFYSLKEPVGVAGQIVPWNYPLMMTTWKLAPALAAGCTIVLKPDSQTPLTALRMAELATEVGFPPGSINVVPGPGTTVGRHLVQHPGVDKIAFTGSTETGAQIMRDASDGIKRLTLELGGKSPNIVFADADMADAIPSSAWSIYYSAGQSCEARSRILVEQSAYDDFVTSSPRPRTASRSATRWRTRRKSARSSRPSTATASTAMSRPGVRKARRSPPAASRPTAKERSIRRRSSRASTRR